MSITTTGMFGEDKCSASGPDRVSKLQLARVRPKSKANDFSCVITSPWQLHSAIVTITHSTVVLCI